MQKLTKGITGQNGYRYTRSVFMCDVDISLRQIHTANHLNQERSWRWNLPMIGVNSLGSDLTVISLRSNHASWIVYVAWELG